MGESPGHGRLHANQFHYYRLTEDDRILWGGYDAIYHYGNAVAPRLEDRDATYSLLSEHFFQTFPQLEGLTFTHRWAGVIDTCSRFCVMWGTALSGKAAYAVGYTGLGVASTRFGARVALDLVDGLDTERTRLQLRPLQAAALPARAAALGRHPAHPPSARPGRPQPRAPRPLAALARPRRAGV